MKTILLNVWFILLSSYCFGQNSIEGIYIHFKPQPPTIYDTSHHKFLASYLKISGSKCYMDVVHVLIQGNDTIPINYSKSNEYFRGSYSFFSGKIKINLGEVIVDYFERPMLLNDNGLPIPNHKIKIILADLIKDGIQIDDTIFKKTSLTITLVSENLTYN